MAAYRRVDDCGLTAYTLGSAPGPTLINEYGKPLLCKYPSPQCLCAAEQWTVTCLFASM